MNGRTILVVLLVVLAVLVVAPLVWMTAMMRMMGTTMAPAMGGSPILLLALGLLGPLIVLAVLLAGRGTQSER